LLPWLNVEKQKKVKVVFAGEKDTNTPTTNAFIKAINSKTKVISFSNASNLFGYEIDIKKIVTAARKINKDIIVIIDGTQSAPHCITNISNWNIDFFVCSAHKMCGPSGVGVM
jgi:selenocysteine lyase/cysteine desulfurase